MARRRRKIYNISQLEKQILILLREHKFEVVSQFVIPNLPYIYDFYFPQLHKILEVQGDYWHCNPTRYKPGSIVKMAGLGNIIVDHIWDCDALKKRSAEKQGYQVIALWESDFKSNGWTAVSKAIAGI